MDRSALSMREHPISAESARDLKALFEGVGGSSLLTDEERERLNYFISEMDKVIGADSIDVLDSPEGTFFAGAYFLLFDLTYSHPGQVPPPFPDVED